MVKFTLTMKKLLIISGQTATGKTDLGVYLAKKFNGEIVSFDSRQAYRYLDIVTGKDYDKLKIKNEKLKITIKNLKLYKYFKDNIPIWLYDLHDPKEYINAYDFCQAAEVVIDDIVKRKKMPIIVGGSVFYIKSFLEGFKTENIGPNWKLRRKLEKLTVEDLQNELRKLDNKKLSTMNQSDRNNKRRLIRTIEIESSKFKVQSSKPKTEEKKRLNLLFLALVLDKEKLKGRIEERVRKRIEEGAIDEVKKLLNLGYSFDEPGLNTIGYKQLNDYFKKRIGLIRAVDSWINAEIDYARRQLVFLKKMKDVVFLNPENKNFLAKTKTLVYKWCYESKD